MMMDRDVGLKLTLGFDGSLQKVITQTMVDQEDIFKNQVHELHRLNKIQKVFMKEDFTVGGGGIQHSFVGSFPENFKYESLTTERRRPSEVHTFCSLESGQNHCLREHRDTLKHQQLSLDLELASSYNTNGIEDLLSLRIAPEDSSLMKHGNYDDNYSSSKIPKLSLGADIDTQQRCSGRKSSNDEIICSPSLQAIHLERSTFVKDLLTVPGCAYGTLATQSGTKNKLETSCSVRGRNSDAFSWVSESQSFTVGMENFREREYLFQGVASNESFYHEQCHHADRSCKRTSSRRKPFSSHEIGELDLNKALPDETSINPIDPQAFNSLQSASSGVTHNEIADHDQATSFTVLDLTKTSAFAQQEITASTVTTSPSEDTCKHICKSKLSSVEFGTEDTVNGSKNVGPGNGQCGISFRERTSERISMSKLDAEEKENKLQSHNSSQELLEGTGSNRSPCKSDCNTDDASSNTKRGCHAIDIPNLNISSNELENVKYSLGIKDHVEQNMTQSSETKSQPFGAEVDKTVRKGAVSLIYFSCLAQYQDCSPRSKKRKKSFSAERAMPEISSESYESIVLKQADCSVDEYCVSSTPLEAMALEKKENGVKLRRGRRMKDFRKEILPSLASLSRQEICEDIKVMELALRSREYKKYNSKTASRGDRISSVRSRRPRLSRGHRRYCY